MLTIKIVSGVNQEEVFEASRVWTQPLNGGPHLNVFYESPNIGGVGCICTEGPCIFVMNDKGKTIAIYN